MRMWLAAAFVLLVLGCSPSHDRCVEAGGTYFEYDIGCGSRGKACQMPDNPAPPQIIEGVDK